MKKFWAKVAAVLLTATAAAGLCACGDATGEGAIPTEDKTVYNNIADYSSQQGYKNWYYLYRDDMGNFYHMTFDLDNGQWNGRSRQCYNSVNEQNPGNGFDTVIGWKASVDGTVDVSGSIVRCPTNWDGDGVFLYVFVNEEGDDYVFSQAVAANEREPYAIEFEAEVEAGDMIYFCIGMVGDNYWDYTRSDITIQYQ